MDIQIFRPYAHYNSMLCEIGFLIRQNDGTEDILSESRQREILETRHFNSRGQ
jgi:hypothetical protein